MIANAHAKGRDKLTFVIPPQLASIGLWLEQLIAESTGKAGTGVLPVAGEPLGDAAAYGDDRLFVHLRQGTARTSTTPRSTPCARPGTPCSPSSSTSPADLGALFVEWEIATALVGAQAAHQPVRPAERPGGQGPHGRDPRGLRRATASCRPRRPGSPAEVLGHAERGRSYVCLQAFVAPDARAPGQARAPAGAALRDALGCAATAGFGPRYLHSTGQYHKGGPPNGVFVQLLAGEQDDEAIPGRPFGFRTLRDAQALGDAGALRGRGLPLARISLAACEAAIERALEHIATTRIST